MNRYQHLAHEERYMIYQLLRKGYSIQKIASQLDRSPSTISREIRRNKGMRGYRYKQAHGLAQKRLKTTHRTVCITPETYDLIEGYLCMDWSPEQISNYLRLEFEIAVSTESIYQFVLSDKVAGGDLYRHLRHSAKQRRKRYGSGYNSRGQLKNRVSIDERPAVVDKKSRVGDWEIDTIIGKRHQGALVSIVERKSRYTLIGRVTSRDTVEVGTTTMNLLSPFKDYVYTITGDNGKEFACHETLAENLNASFYFAHPYSSWERGLNENTNGLIRQYVPKGSDLTPLTQKDIQKIMSRLNGRPRKCLGYKTPEAIFFKAIGLLSTHRMKVRRMKTKNKTSCAVALTN